jgi:hypothetical protein
LTRAFIFAGTPTVVATLWDVNDEATALLMERFYTHLKKGVGKAEALRQAQLELIEEYPDPYYWSAFVMSGDGGEVSVERSKKSPETAVEAVEQTASAGEAEGGTESTASAMPWGWLIGGGGLLVVVVVGGVLWRRRNQNRETQEVRMNE